MLFVGAMGCWGMSCEGIVVGGEFSRWDLDRVTRGLKESSGPVETVRQNIFVCGGGVRRTYFCVKLSLLLMLRWWKSTLGLVSGHLMP